MVPELRPYAPTNVVKLWRGYTTHEIGHHAPEVQDTLPFLMKHKITYENVFGRIMNVLDDIRNELNHRVQQFPGFREDLSWTQAYHALQGIKMVKDKGFAPEMEPFIQAISLAYQWRALQQPHVAYPASLWESHLGTKYAYLFDALETMSTIEDVYAIAQEFCDQAKSEDSDQEKEEDKGEGQEGEEGEGEGSSSPENGENEGDSEGQSRSAGEGTDDDDPESEETRASGEVSYKDLMAHQHQDDSSKPGDWGDFDFTIRYDHEAVDDYTPHSAQHIIKARDIKEQRRPNRPEGVSNRSITTKIEEGEKLSAKARRLFQARMQRRSTHNNRTGRLDKRDLYRVPSGAQDVFKRKINGVSNKGIAVMILGDASSSMEGKPYDCMAAGAVLLNEAVTPLGIPVSIALFTDDYASKHYIIKDFNERRTRDQLLRDFFLIESNMGCNADGEAVLWAWRRLKQRREERKLLIVLSDGMPSSTMCGDAATYTKEVVAHVSKDIECYGIGIQSKSVANFYPDHTVLQTPRELEACLLEVIKQKVFA